MDNLHKAYRLGIVTGRPRKEANYVLERFDVKNYFDVVITMEDIPSNKGKPDPYGLNLALKKLNVQQACYVGDNIDDIKSAVSAGVVPIGIILSYAYRKKVIELFKNAGAKYILRNINDIREVLK